MTSIQAENFHPSIASLINRFRHEAPTASSDRIVRRQELAKQFWWLDDESVMKNLQHTVESEAQTEDSLNKSVDVSTAIDSDLLSPSFLEQSQSSLPPPPPPPVFPTRIHIPVSQQQVPLTNTMTLDSSLSISSVHGQSWPVVTSWEGNDSALYPMNVLAVVEEEFRRLQANMSSTHDSSDSESTASDGSDQSFDDKPLSTGELLDRQRQDLLHRSAQLIRRYQRRSKKLIQQKHLSMQPSILLNEASQLTLSVSQPISEQPTKTATSNLKETENQLSVSSSAEDVMQLLATLRRQRLLSDDDDDKGTERRYENTANVRSSSDSSYNCEQFSEVDDDDTEAKDDNNEKDDSKVCDASIQNGLFAKDVIVQNTTVVDAIASSNGDVSQLKQIEMRKEDSSPMLISTFSPRPSKSSNYLQCSNFSFPNRESDSEDYDRRMQSLQSSLSSVSVSLAPVSNSSENFVYSNLGSAKDQASATATEALMFVSSSSETGGFASYLLEQKHLDHRKSSSASSQGPHQVSGTVIDSASASHAKRRSSTSVAEMWRIVSPYVSSDEPLQQLWEEWLHLKQFQEQQQHH